MEKMGAMNFPGSDGMDTYHVENDSWAQEVEPPADPSYYPNTMIPPGMDLELLIHQTYPGPYPDPPESSPSSDSSSNERVPSSRTSYTDDNLADSYVASEANQGIDFWPSALNTSMPIPEGVLNLERPQCQNFSVPYDNEMQKRAQYRCLHAACKGKPFGRSYELIRHNKEQHLCPHEDCKDIEFASAQEKKEHEKRCHKTDFRCGTCLLKDLHAKPFRRVDKLRSHFKREHKAPHHFDYRQFQCTYGACYVSRKSDGCGGLFFASDDELEMHKEQEHPQLFSPSMMSSELSNREFSSGSSSFETVTQIPQYTPHLCQGSTVAKRPMEHDEELGAKRGKTQRQFDMTAEVLDQTIAISNSKLMERTASPTDSYHYLPLQNSEPILNQRMDHSSQLGRTEQELPLTLLELQSLTKHEQWDSVLDRLDELKIESNYDCRRTVIKLCGSGLLKDMESGREALAELIDDIRVSSPHDTKSHSSPIPKPDLGFRQQVSVHPHPEILPLDPDEDAELLSLWNNRLLRMMPSIVHDALIEESYSVALVRQKEPDGSQPIIRFRSTEGQGETARQIIRERVKDICTENGIHSLDVQFTEGSLVRLAGGSSVTTIRDDPPNDSSFPHQRRPWGRPGMGASIGPGSCPHISATLGGYVSVSGAIYMLSVEHFMIPSVKQCCALTSEVRSPSIGDISVVGRAIENKLKALTLDFTNKTQGGMSLRQAESLFSGTTDQELDLYSQYKRDLCGDFSLGNIKYMSHGPRIRSSVNPSSMGTPHRVDWSLFKAEAKHREGQNKHRFRRISQPPLNDLLLEAVAPTGAGALCDTTGDLRGWEKVHYVGTTSGFREGYVNPARIQLNYDGIVSEEWSMITNDCQNSRSDDFEGDSGAWIISDDNKLLGLLWGWDNGSLIFTPIKDVFEDISEKTRLRNVRLPMRPRSRARGQTQLLSRTTDTADHSDLSTEDGSLVPQEETKSEIPLRLLELFEPGAKSQRRRSSSASSISNVSICSTPSLSSAVSSEYDPSSPGTPSSPGKVCSPSANGKFRNFVLSIRPRAQSVSSAVSEDWVHIAQEDVTIEKPPDMAGNELQQPNRVSCVV